MIVFENSEAPLNGRRAVLLRLVDGWMRQQAGRMDRSAIDRMPRLAVNWSPCKSASEKLGRQASKISCHRFNVSRWNWLC